MTTIELIGETGTLTLPPFATSGWVHSGLVDWYSLTGDKSPVHERAQAHGAFGVGRSYRKAATPSFTALYLGESAADFLRGAETLTAIAAEGPVIMRVTDELRVTERVVTIDAATVEDTFARAEGEISVDCVARDPRRYSVGDSWVTARPARVTGGLTWPVRWAAIWAGDTASDGRVKLTNQGTRSSAPIYRVYGGFRSFSITNIEEQRVVGFDLPVSSGSFVELDFGRRTAMLNAVSDVTRHITSREWWLIPGNSTVSAQFALAGESVDPYFSGKVRSAW